MYCPKCGSVIDEQSDRCKNCGEPITEISNLSSETHTAETITAQTCQTGAGQQEPSQNLTERKSLKLRSLYMKKITCMLIILMLITTGCSVAKTGSEQSVPEISTSEIYLTVVIKQNLGQPIFNIKTNLPDEISLMFSVEDNAGYLSSDKVIISNGCGSTSQFSSLGNSLNGNYTLTITTPYTVVMPSSVRKIIGENGELMTGKFIFGFETGIDKRVAACYDFTIDGNANDEIELTPYFDPFLNLPTNTADEVAEQTKELTRETKLEVLGFINGQLDPLYETDISDKALEEKANEVWIAAEQKFGITEDDILSIMLDSDVKKEYYASLDTSSLANGDGASQKNNSIVTNYEAILDNNGYSVTVGATKDFVSEFVRYVGEENYDAIDMMLTNGYIAKLPHGTKINVAEYGFSISKVDILEGGLKGISVYVINECIQEN